MLFSLKEHRKLSRVLFCPMVYMKALMGLRKMKKCKQMTTSGLHQSS
jgi:hypothetical protein